MAQRIVELPWFVIIPVFSFGVICQQWILYHWLDSTAHRVFRFHMSREPNVSEKPVLGGAWP